METWIAYVIASALAVLGLAFVRSFVLPALGPGLADRIVSLDLMACVALVFVGVVVIAGEHHGLKTERLRSWLAFAMLPFLVASCVPQGPSRTTAPADSAAGEVAIRLVQPGDVALLVPVVINGEGPFDFVLDTGATMVCLTDSLAQRLDLPPRSMPFGFQIGVQGRERARIVDIDSMRVGAASAEDLPGCIIDLQMLQVGDLEIHGLLGLNFLKNFHVTFDFERSIVRFE